MSEFERSCSAIHPLLPAFSIGATDPEETAEVQAHVAGCPQAAAELTEFQALSEALLFSAPQTQAPEGLRDTIRAASASPPSESTSRSRPQPAPARDSLWHRLRNSLATPQLRPAFALGALALVAFLAAALYLGAQVSRLRASQADLVALASQQQDVLAQVGEGTFLRIALPAGPAGEASGAYATVVCDPSETSAFVLAENLPVLASDQAYQVWLIHGDERVSGGLFRPNSQGNGSITFRAPQPMGSYDAIGISAEPAAGSASPTSPPVIRGELYGGADYQRS